MTDNKMHDFEVENVNILKIKELQRFIAQKDKFFSIMAHDLKTPLNSILGFSELLLERVRENDLEGIEEFADVIHKSSVNVVDLLTNLTVWSRTQTGRTNYNPQSINLLSLVEENMLLFLNIAKNKRIEIRHEVDGNMSVYVDIGMGKALLRNLISNAIKFTPMGGYIVISTLEQSNGVTVSVKDNGVGISERDMEKLFRIDEIHTTNGTHDEHGTGMGLIICKEFVEIHGGKIWVDSLQGKGSVFSFTLPHNVEDVDESNFKVNL
jgi:signal transduction histidine kinase